MPQTILLIESIAEDVRRFRAAHERDGYGTALVVAGSSSEANLLMQDPTLQERVSMVVLEPQLGLAQDLRVLREVRESFCMDALPIVVFTHSRDVAEVAAAYELGVNGYVRKPDDHAEYERAVADLLRFWEGYAITGRRHLSAAGLRRSAWRNTKRPL
jgi:two-component system, response regulator